LKPILGIAALVILIGGGLYIADLPLFKPAPPGADQVVLLHGLGRTESAMLILENSLAGAGFEVHNIGYPSNDATPDQLVAQVTAAIDDCCASSGRTVHFVGHSLGGLLIRAYLARGLPENLGRVVLLGTPNHGSELADLEEGLPGTMVELAGPTAQMLGTGPDGFAASLPPPNFEVGVIAGTRDALVTNEWLPLPNDSMVSLESAKLPGMSDFRAYPVTHWGLRNNSRVAEATIHFLENGMFPPPAADEGMGSPEESH
jgi:pimeloyl-ACP methyl ester carboxylesterase